MHHVERNCALLPIIFWRNGYFRESAWINLKNAEVWHSDLPFFLFFFKQAGCKRVSVLFTRLQLHNLYTLLTSTLFSLATDYTATSYIYQSLGDVEWYIKMKLSSWQQWVKYRKSPRRSQCSENRSLESGDKQVGRWWTIWKNSCILL